MGVSILFDNKKIIFYKGPKSFKNVSKTYVLTSGTLKKRFLMIFSSRLVVELFFLVGFRPILSIFLHFLFFFRVRIPAGAFFWPKIAFRRENITFFKDSSLF